MPPHEADVPILRDDHGERVAHGSAEPVRGPVSRSYALDRLERPLDTLDVTSASDLRQVGARARDLGPEAENLEALGQNDGTVHRGETRDEVGHLEHRFVERGNLRVFAQSIFWPARECALGALG